MTVALLGATSPAVGQDATTGTATPVDVGARVVTPTGDAASAADGGAFYVQFAAPLSGPDRDALSGQGVTFAQAIPLSTYLVRLASGSSAAVAAVPGFVGFEPVSSSDRLSPALRDNAVPVHATSPDGAVVAQVQFFGGVSLAEALAAADASGVAVADPGTFLAGHRLDVTADLASLEALAASDVVRSVREATASPDASNLTAQQVSNVDDVHVAGGSGDSVILGMWDEGAVRGTHQDLGPSALNNDGGVNSDHSTHVAGTMIGNGTDPAAEGIAFAAPILEAYDFLGDVVSEMTAAEDLQGIIAANHSWNTPTGYHQPDTTWYGEAGFGAYGTTSADWDTMIAGNGLITVQSAGNDRTDCDTTSSDPTDSCDGFLAGDGQYYDNIGHQGNAKNVITVGSVDDDGTTLSSFSSAGPADDGRIKPDVIANGSTVYSTCAATDTDYCTFSGTSQAASVVTGVVALLEERYRGLHAGATIPADTARAVLVNTAVDLGRAGPDYLHGFGLVDALAASQQLTSAATVSGSVADSGVDNRTIEVAPGTTDLRVTLNWLDPAGVADSAAADVTNNLDLELVEPNGTTIHHPFTGPGRSNPTGLATATGANSIDTVEHARVSSPVAGTWTVRVSGTNVPSGPQGYAVVTSSPLTAGICAEDGSEQNDTQLAAAGLSDGVPVSAMVCTEDDDWFSLPVTAGFQVSADAVFTHASGDLDLQLFDPAGSLVASSQTGDDNESLSHTATQTGDYAARVYGFLGAENGYDLTMATAAPTVCPPDDGFEDNDTELTAAPIDYETPTAAVVCSGDDDYFLFPVARSAELTITADFLHADGDIDIQLFDPTGTPVAISQTADDNELITYTALDPGDYAVRVYGFAAAQNAYTLTVDAPPVIRPFGVVLNPEGDTGSQVVDVKVFLDRPFADPVTVDWSVVDTANPLVAQIGSDVAAGSGVLTFDPGETERTIPVTVFGDTLDEPPLFGGEWGLVRFQNASANATLDLRTFFGLALVIIIDDD